MSKTSMRTRPGSGSSNRSRASSRIGLGPAIAKRRFVDGPAGGGTETATFAATGESDGMTLEVREA